MTNEEMKEIVRECINKSGVDCLESCWEVWDEDCIQLDGDFSLAELEAFCAALKVLQAKEYKEAVRQLGEGCLQLSQDCDSIDEGEVYPVEFEGTGFSCKGKVSPSRTLELFGFDFDPKKMCKPREEFLLVYLRCHSWELVPFLGFEEAVAEAVQGKYDGDFSPVAIANKASGELKIINTLTTSNIEYECKEFLLEETGCNFAVSERVDLDDLWREMSKKKEEA